MAIHEEIKLFGQSQIRSVWDDEKEQWFFSVVDVVEVLTESKDPMSYINKGWGQIVTPLIVPTTIFSQQMSYH